MATVTLITKQAVSNTSSITFNSLGAYKDIRAIMTVNTNVTGNYNGVVAMRFNGDSGNNYRRTFMANENANLLTQGQNTGLNGLLIANAISSADNPSDSRCIADIYIPEYGNSNKFKSMTGYSWSGNYQSSHYNYMWIISGQWNSTSAITSINFYTTGGQNMVAGFISLYGIS